VCGGLVRTVNRVTAEKKEGTVTDVITGENSPAARPPHAAIAHSTYLPFDAMGHDLPAPLVDQIVTAIAENATRVGAVERHQP
jgi:hypothetical protein